MRLTSRFGASLLLGLVMVAGCEGPTQETSAAATPSRADFFAVSEALQVGCGSLDCHGDPGRNLLLYGEYGLRLDAADEPGGEPTRPLEHDANFDSVVALEPELMDRVVAQGGARPERLTLVRKARGSEAHEGDAAAPEGGAIDRCVLSWLSGATDASACEQAAVFSNPFDP